MLVPLVLSFLPAADTPPNIVVIFTDDQGYADVGTYADLHEQVSGGRLFGARARGWATPNLDRLAAEGMRLTNCYVSQAVCSASRASLLTGCYNVRVGIRGALGPNSNIGLHPDEVTIADLAKTVGYATAAYGKWHLGDAPEFLPHAQGFDDYVGLMYSNDMWPFHPATITPEEKAAGKKGRTDPPLPLVRSTADQHKQILQAALTANDQKQLTSIYTKHAAEFIDAQASAKKPFLLYLAHSMPHVPIFVSNRYEGTQSAGLYGDVIAEVDWSVGNVLHALERNGVADNTFIFFCSDNGPWLSYGDHAGSAGLFREGKGTTFEGGVRTPALAWMPGKIPAGSDCNAMCGTIDILPTIAGLIGAKQPDRKIDGRDLWPLLSGHPQAVSPHDAYHFYWGDRLEAVRSGRWKLHFRHNYRHVDTPGSDGQPGKQSSPVIEESLFDLVSDPAETTDVAADHPDVVERLKAFAEEAREELGDGKRKGSGVRPAGRVGDSA